MTSPWLSVPLADYEGHMSAPQVAQLAALSDLFAVALRNSKPASVAILGVAGGNGLERIDPSVTKRVVGYDVHQDYLQATQKRFAKLPGLELIQCDLSSQPQSGAFDLVHAALVLEHAGSELCLETACALVGTGGTLSVVLQLASTLSTSEAAAVAPTGFGSIQNLAPNFRLIDRTWLADKVTNRGFVLQGEATVAVASGKSLWHGTFRKSK